MHNDISPLWVGKNLKIKLLRVEKYHNPLIAEGESVSPITKCPKYFYFVNFRRKLARILMQKFNL
jgi:hypothetical protein